MSDEILETLSDDAVALLSGHVADGVAMLDGFRPGWEDAIDEFTLEIESCTACVLGQIFGSFSHGLRALEMSEDDAVACGMEADFGITDEVDEFDQYQALTALWRRRLTDRRALREEW